MSLLGNINTALTALQASEQALAITGHNIANGNTPGYTRQAPDLQALPLEPLAEGPLTSAGLSGGVIVAGVTRSRDQFADAEYRQSLAQQSADQAQSDALDHLQGLLGEPSDSGLQAATDHLFQNFSNLANDPENAAVRATVAQAATALGNGVQRLWQGLTEARSATDNKLAARVADLNAAAAQLVTLNQRLVKVQVSGGDASDLLDQRDLLVDHIAGLTGAQIIAKGDGTVNVNLNGHLLVGPAGAEPITVVPGAGGVGVPTWPNGSAVSFPGGEMGGLLVVRDQQILGVQNALTTWVASLVSTVNATHAAGTGLDGSTGNPFFDPASTPATLRLSSAVAANPSAIAASQTGAPGNGANAQAISRLALQTLPGGGNLTSNYQGMVGSLGVQAQQVGRNLQADGLLVRQSDALRQSAGGVSLDEEAANMVRYQRSYQAAAHFVSVIDSLLQTLIERV